MIVGLLLAAGGARRFGSQKLVATLDGAPLVRHAADTLASLTDSLIVVIGNDGNAVREVLDGTTVRFVENLEWANGLSGSIRCGVAAVPPNADAIVVMLGDEPRVDAAVVRTVIDLWRSTGSAIVAPRYRGKRGHPVLFDRAVFAELAELAGDVGAKPVIERTPERVAFVDIDANAPGDVDTMSDLERLSR